MENQFNNSIQSSVFAAITDKLPAHLSLVDVLADILEISRDSAYRRMRGETELSLNEAIKLSQKFAISLDSLSYSISDHIVFQNPHADSEDIEEKFRQVYHALGQIEQAQNGELIYFSMELPFFHILQIPELFSFKLQYWQSISQPNAPLPQVVIEPQPLSGLALELMNRYIRIPGTEIIYESALSTTLRQILYFMEAGAFVRPQDGLRVLEGVRNLVAHLKAQAALGRKFRFGAPAPEHGLSNTFRLYFNEMIYSQNIAYCKAGNQASVFIEHNITHFLRTENSQFCAETYKTLQTILSKSIPISHVAERERNKFFNRLDASVIQTKEKAKVFLEG